MKALFNHPFLIYAAATLASLCIMIIIDYVLGAEAEHLNAWVIITQWFGYDTGIGDSLAIRKLGLYGATLAMLLVNTCIGVLLIQGIRLFIRFIHS